MGQFESKQLIVLEMANNHMGDVSHGMSLIDALAAVVEPFRTNFDFAIKYQFRNLETFIHPDFKGSDLKFVKRFEETVLSKQQWDELISHGRKRNFFLIVTPFDETSVEKALSYDIDFIKIASCSLADWPLLERVASTQKEVIFSTAGAHLSSIDNMVSFFANRDIEMSLMHCVGLYPTPFEKLNIGQVAFYKSRYPGIKIGYSTHEDPSLTETAAVAYALGAQVFEKHVALETDAYGKNAYSAGPEDLKRWLECLQRAVISTGKRLEKVENGQDEVASLRDLQRAMFAKKSIPAGVQLTSDDVYFAIPYAKGGYVANDFSKYSAFITTQLIEKDDAVNSDNCDTQDLRKGILTAVLKISDYVKQANIVVPDECPLEVSHHYGIERFYDTGLAMATVVNEEYCKKILIMLPGQSHPEQYHKMKKETFHVIHGAATLVLDGVSSNIKTSDVVTIEPGVRHSFATETGCVIEEISSTHFVDDSYYTDESIALNENRKTFVKFWK